MGLGVLEDRVLQNVPGTATLEELNNPEAPPPQSSAKLKRSKDGIILVPQPSSSPQDPLNWPLWRRDVIIVILSILSVIGSTMSSLLAANTLTLTLYFRRDFTDISLLTGYHVLGTGIAGFICVPTARVWGKRHLYLLGTVIILFSSVWGGASKSYGSLLGARIFQGFGLAPFESLVNASVGDLYYVHERGTRMALSNMALFGGAFFTPVIVGKMTSTLGWQWTFYFIGIFVAIILPFVYLYVPETAYRRDVQYDTDVHQHELPDKTETTNSSDVSSNDVRDYTRGPTIKETIPLFNGRKSDENFWKMMFRPLPLFIQPDIVISCLIQGSMIGWTVFIGTILAAVMLGPPLFFDEVKTGYLYGGAFIGACVGFVLSGLLSDPAAKFMTRLNKGVYEPEFRLILVIPMMIIGCAGLYGFGITSADIARYGWVWPDFFFGAQVAGMVLGTVASACYLVDAHRDLAIECFTCLLIFKNFFSFGLTFSSYDWLNEGGIKNVMIAIASVQVGVCALAIPLYVFGKRMRSFWARNDLLTIFKLR